MIIAQIVIDGRSHSVHRFSQVGQSVGAVRRLLHQYVRDEALYTLGLVEIRVQGQSGLARLREALWPGGDSRRRP
ncbi:MAG: hypothetical protein VKP62_15020 [Candidatus Sericytochromatia bacterium]|nr:hypothetical protein [Candidatus Sericytochromatia bacterium]